jgi:hypothetical protein
LIECIRTVYFDKVFTCQGGGWFRVSKQTIYDDAPRTEFAMVDDVIDGDQKTYPIKASTFVKLREAA